ncbi:MAG: HIT family protein [Pseudomonadota bacterium]
MNPTIEKFGYPATLLREYQHWVLLLRPKQATLGSMVLANKSDATRPGDLSAEAYAELASIKRELEATLRHCFAMDKINYLMLMMVDREVHYHVLPRYAGDKEFEGIIFADPGWPKVPDLGHATPLTEDQFTRLAEHLKASWISLPDHQ